MGTFHSVLQITTDPSKYEPTANGTGATGVVYWNDGTCIFPDNDWNDFVTVVAGWWVESIKQLKNKYSSTAFHFMDGPFSIEAKNLGPVIKLFFLDGRRGKKVVCQTTTTFKTLEQQIFDFSDTVLEFCEKKSIIGPDVDYLRSAVKKR